MICVQLPRRTSGPMCLIGTRIPSYQMLPHMLRPTSKESDYQHPRTSGKAVFQIERNSGHPTSFAYEDVRRMLARLCDLLFRS